MKFIEAVDYKGIEVFEDQNKFISNIDKIKKELLVKSNKGYYIFENDEKIGFILIRRNSVDSIFLWDYIIDKKFQNKRYGYCALIEFIDFLKHTHGINTIITSYIYGNDHAKYLYEKVGFVEIDVVNDGLIHEVDMKYSLNA